MSPSFQPRKVVGDRENPGAGSGQRAHRECEHEDRAGSAAVQGHWHDRSYLPLRVPFQKMWSILFLQIYLRSELFGVDWGGTFNAGADPGGDRPPKIYESNLIRHDFVQFGKKHRRYKPILPSIVFVTAVLWSMLHLSYSNEPAMTLDYQMLLKSPPNLRGWIRPWFNVDTVVPLGFLGSVPFLYHGFSQQFVSLRKNLTFKVASLFYYKYCLGQGRATFFGLRAEIG